MSNLNAWNKWYASVASDAPPFLYGDETTYLLAASFLQDCKTVEDWGCGLGGFRLYRQEGYLGIDGTTSPFADIVEDLRLRKSSPEGILLRHVIEHDRAWKEILDAALVSATKKLALVLFTPSSAETKVIAENAIHGVDVPDISFAARDLEERFELAGFRYALSGNMTTATGYGTERIYYGVRS